MKVVVALVLVFTLVCSVAPPIYAEPRQVSQGTEIHLTLLDPISSATAREGDPFVAVVARPVVAGSLVVIPAGTRIRGTVSVIQRAKSFSVFRGYAGLNLMFRTMEVDSRLVPVELSIVAIGTPRVEGESRERHDIQISEGEFLEAKHDYKGDVIGGGVVAGGSSVIGAIAGNVARGFGIGLAGSAAYIMVRKGKDLDLPAQTGLLVRMENTITMPALSAGTVGGN